MAKSLPQLFAACNNYLRKQLRDSFTGACRSEPAVKQTQTFQDRVELMLKRAGGSKPLARFLGVSDTAVNGWRGGTTPFESTMKKICERTGLHLLWLRDGLGDTERELSLLEEGMRAAGEGESTLAETTALYARRERPAVPPPPLPSQVVAEASSPRGKLKMLLTRLGLNIPQFAKAIGYDAGIVRNVIEGYGRASEKMIETIVATFPEYVTKDELMDGCESPIVLRDDGMEGIIGQKPTILLPPGVRGFMVPLLSAAQAGAWDACHEDGGWTGESVLALNVDDRRAFAVTVAGNSMEPELHEGDVVICSPAAEVHNGECAVVRTESGQTFIKFWRADGKTVRLESANPDHPPLTFHVSEIYGRWPVVQTISAKRITKRV